MLRSSRDSLRWSDMAPPLVLWVLLAARATALSCVCTPSECEEVLEWECPGGGVVWDACGCCRVCARVEDEPCGGPDGFHGSCAPGLHCVLDPSQLLPQRAQRGEARGTCKRVPGALVGALREEEGSEGSNPCPEGTKQDSVFGCDIVGRVCRCSSLPACTSAERKKREEKQDDGGANKSPFTFSTLEECEMNLAEVLRQEEVPPSVGRGFISLAGRNCSISGCDGAIEVASPSADTEPCPEGSARVEGNSGGVGSGPCLCLPSLCPTAYLPFSCPFGARVLRRASRIPGDCCDQYECASPPPDFRELVAEASKVEEKAVSAKGKEEKGEGTPKKCPKGSERNKTVIGCDIVGKVCRCTRLPACSSRSRKRRKKGGGEEDNPFTFTTLDECKDRLAEMLRKEEVEEDEPSDSRGE